MPLLKERMKVVWQGKHMDNNVFIIDTNVVLRFLLEDDDIQSPIAKKYLSYQKYDFIVPTAVICEVVWVLKKSVKLSNSFIAEILQNFVLLENIKVNETEFDNGLKFLLQGGDFADGVIAHHIEDYSNACFLSFDKKAQKISNHFNLTCIEPS